MIQLTGAGKRYGPKILFEGVDWLVTPNERVGIVGANGTGKSSILKVLGGMEGLDSGTISTQKAVTIGYLPQEGLSLSGRSVFAECMTVFAGLRALEMEQEDLARRMGELEPGSAEYTQVAERFHMAESEFRARDGFTVEAQVGAVLSGLGFAQREWKKHTEEFSGGWQMRIALAKLLLEKPNLLLLDEPTNHLDLEARNWLEEYLSAYPNAFVLVSHDRYFLDVTVRKIAELWNKGLHFYTGGFSRYELQKDERRTQLQSAYENQQDKIRQLEAFINRFRYQATKAKQVQSRIKELEKIEKIEIPPEEKTIHFSFPQPKPSGRIVAEFKKVAKSYGDHLVFSDVDFIIERADRVALVGVNGAGKSTLIKILAGAETVTAGEYLLGHNANPDYFAQDQYKELDQEARIIDDLAIVAPRATNTELRSILGSFLFSEDDVFKPIGVLSGGERNRYALARMLMVPSNFMLLDEPTNHLDMRAKDVLLTAIQNYTGTVVFVSHDRYFIDKLATRIIEVEDGRVKVYPGNYEDYLWRKQGGGAPESVETETRSVDIPAPDAAKEADKAGDRRLNPIKLRQMKERRHEIEEEVTRLEAEIANYEASLAHFVSVEETQRTSDLLNDRKTDLESLLAEWEEVAQSIEANS
ncbi:MAG TPA: ABC-F family ATP-binding cassette domain-containing protein [Candidatus Sulfopaludibacter sp.]|jgi:ATP-binding cassette subfamily F protein 3|nr:ABC-F family ATP-binding cassette domain-containing protein [Candidatus Sulfopaludibacter sp.]